MGRQSAEGEQLGTGALASLAVVARAGPAEVAVVQQAEKPVGVRPLECRSSQATVVALQTKLGLSTAARMRTKKCPPAPLNRNERR